MARSSPWLLGEAGFMCGWPLCAGRQGLCGCSLGIYLCADLFVVCLCVVPGG